MKTHLYTPPDKALWQGRSDALANEQLYQQIKCVSLTDLPIATQNKSFAILGFCCDEGVRRNKGRIGAFEGPQAIREKLGRLSTHFSNPITVFDVGNIVCKDHELETAQQALGEAVALLCKQGFQPIVLGGGHETAWGHYQGFEDTSSLGIVNFDAHFDLRPLNAENQGHSGTPFLQIARDRQSKNLSFDYLCIGIQDNANTRSLFETAKQLKTTYIDAEKLYQDPKASLRLLDLFVKAHDKIYLTICLDVFNTAFAPGVSAPQPLGLAPWQVVSLIEHITQSGKVMSVDVVELSPPLDQNQKTASLAAALVMSYLTAASDVR